MTLETHIAQAVAHLQQGHIIAYPTEAIYGLGCDPFNEYAVLRLYELKKRDPVKGYILVASNWQQIEPLILPLTTEQSERVNATWPGPVTWVFPAAQTTPKWLVSQNNTIALRLTAFPIVQTLCQQFGKPLVSTSANLSGQVPVKTSLEVEQSFGNSIDYILPGIVGGLEGPTPIRDVITGDWYRK